MSRGVLTVIVAVAVAALGGCTDDTPRPDVPDNVTPVDRSAANPAEGVTTELDGAAPAYGEALLAELAGDEASARVGFERVLAATGGKSLGDLFGAADE